MIHIGDKVVFGPPNGASARGVVLRFEQGVAVIKQTERGHGRPPGTKWDVPVVGGWIRPDPSAQKKRSSPPKVRRSSRPPSPVPKRRSSRPPPPSSPPRHGSLTESWAVGETKALLSKWGVPPFKVEFNNRQTRALGKVNYRTRIISYSRPLWARATDEQKNEVVIHEVAHAVVEHREGRKPGTSHGYAWKAQMIDMGIPAHKVSAYHTIDRTGLHRIRSDSVELMCCGKKFGITMKRLARAVRIDADGDLTIGRLKCAACDERPTIKKSDVQRVIDYLRRGAPLRPNQICGCR